MASRAVTLALLLLFPRDFFQHMMHDGSSFYAALFTPRMMLVFT